MNDHYFLSRRSALKTVSSGFGYLAFAALAHERALAEGNPLAPKQSMLPARAKRVIFLFHAGSSFPRRYVRLQAQAFRR